MLSCQFVYKCNCILVSFSYKKKYQFGEKILIGTSIISSRKGQKKTKIQGVDILNHSHFYYTNKKYRYISSTQKLRIKKPLLYVS